MGAALSAGALAAQPVRVTVDLSFGKMMQPREHKSLAHQLVRAYGLNRKAPKPLALHFSALALAEAEAPAMLPADGKWRSWPDLERVAAPAAEQWPAERLVWLSPDAEAPLLELDPAATYVVGGLVDRSVVQHATTDRARACGAPAVRLPLREFAPRSDVHTILNVVDVVQMLAARHSGRSWEEAIADHVPQRFVDRREREERQRREL